MLIPTTGKLSKFGVVQGITETRTIPNELKAQGSGGTLKITATWIGICGLDPAGCLLTFTLRRDGVSKKAALGYAQNALFGNAAPKMILSYSVPSSEVSGAWTLDVKGSTGGNVNDVEPTISFTPRCQDN